MLVLDHIMYDDEDSQLPTFWCEYCIFTTEEADEMRRHHKEDVYTHFLADSPYQDQTLLLYSVIAVFNLAAVATCRYCGKTFASATSITLYRHARLHGSSLNFPHLTNHITARDHLITKMSDYTANFPYICLQHDIVFPTAEMLYLHVSSVQHPNQQYLCPLCIRRQNQIRERVGNLQKHLREKHGKEIRCPMNKYCKLNITNTDVVDHVRYEHHHELWKLPEIIRQTSSFNMLVPDNTSGPVIFKTRQAVHTYPNNCIENYVFFSITLGLRLPIDLEGPNYFSSKVLMETYKERLFGYKV